MIKLSVVIITFNEEENIDRCIDSILTIADEILVVDSYSTDKTLEICENKGVTTLQHSFEGYLEQQQFALENAKYNHILSLDADESLSDKAVKLLRGLKENWVEDAYRLNRLNNYEGKFMKTSGWYPDRKIRLFNREVAFLDR